MIKQIIFITLLFLLVSFGSNASINKDPAVAIVNGHKIQKSVFSQTYEQNRLFLSQTRVTKEKVLNDLINRVKSDNRIALNGITAADDSLNHFLSVFEGQEAVTWDAEKLLPKNTSFFMGFSFSNRDLFYRNLEKYFELSDSYFDRESKIKEVEKGFRLDSRNALRSLVKNQVVAAITSVSGELNNKSTLFILNNDTRSNSRELLETILKNYAKNFTCNQ